MERFEKITENHSGKTQEYIGLVTLQMRCKKARDMVALELQNHIEDQTEAYEEFGLTHNEAEARAVEQMGDPVEVGTRLDRVHRPKTDFRMIAYIAFLTVAGMLVQYFMKMSSANMVNPESVIGFGNIANILFDGLTGFALMLVVMFVDYSFLGKHPVAAYAVVILVLFIYPVSDLSFWGRNLAITNLSGLNVIVILLFAAIVYHYRNNSYKGILICLMWLLAGFITLCRIQGISLAGALSFFATGIVTLSFAVYKGWFNIKRKSMLIILCAIMIVPPVCAVGALAMGIIGAPYQIARVRAFINPYSDPSGSGYIVTAMRERLAGLHFIGSSVGEESNNWWYSLSFIMEKYGIMVGILLIGVLALLFGKMLSGVIRQQNRLGGLLGIGAISYLLVSTILHVLTSLTLIPATSAYLPFFTEGTTSTIGCYLLLGVYLSVHRNAMILSERKSIPKRQLRICIEHVKEE